jgi:hypothetical protein
LESASLLVLSPKGHREETKGRKLMAIRKGTLSALQLTSLLLLVLSSVSAVADDGMTFGGVRFGVKLTGSNDHGFSISAYYNGTGDKKCRDILVTLKTKSGSKKFGPFKITLSPRSDEQYVDSGEVTDEDAPLSEPSLTAKCE